MSSYNGTISCRSATMGDAKNFTVARSGVANFPIGSPTFTDNPEYPSLGSKSYSSETGVGLTTTTTPSEAFSKFDSWINTYLLDAPPTLTIVSTQTTTEYIQVTWSNPEQKKLAFLSGYIPQISAIKADIKPSSSDWTQAWTITLESPSTGKPSVTSLKIMLDYHGGTSSLDSGQYTFYASDDSTQRISTATYYDIRVYAINDVVACGAKTPRYIQFKDLATASAGVPNVPTNVVISDIGTTSCIATWNASTDPDTSSVSSFYITRYCINIIAIGGTRYPSFLDDHTNPQYTTETFNTDADTSVTLSNLRPGTIYNVTVQAKNAVNPSYGPESSVVQFTTSDPSSPPWPSTTTSFKSSYCYGSGSDGYDLAGTTQKTRIFKYKDVLSGSLEIDVSNVRTNNTGSDTASNTGTIIAYGGDTGAEYSTSITTTGFGGTRNTESTNTAIRCVASGDTDYYSSSASLSGFWKAVSIECQAKNVETYYRSKDTSYSMYCKFEPLGGTAITTTPLTFYIDELDNLPSVVSTTIFDATGIEYITGVPTYTTSSTFSFQTVIRYLAYRFLRNDLRHFTVAIQTSSGATISDTMTVSKTSMTGTNLYYSAPSTSYVISTSLHNTSGTVLAVNPSDVQFNTFSIALSSAAGSVFDEALKITVTPYNLQGTGSTYQSIGYTSSSTGSSKSLRVDTQSLTEIGRYTGSSAGALMSCGSGQYPSSGYTSVLDHSTTILGTDQLQLVNGLWITKLQGTGYKDYSGYHFPGVSTPVDYSATSDTGYKYVCWKFTNLSSSTYNQLAIQFDSSGLTVDSTTNTANFRMYMKIEGVNYWLSCTDAISGSGYGAISSDGSGIMNYSASSLGKIQVYTPTATSGTSTVYVRVGLDMTTSQSISNIRLTTVSS